MKRLALLSTAAFLSTGTAHAQSVVPVPTNIEADIAPALSLGTTVNSAGSVTTIDGGQLAGTNLFHSFAVFDLGVGDTARWVHSGGDAAGIGNVVNRVTGGSFSTISGTIDATAIPNADFFFINPAGIVFGEGAQVNVPAAAHFSTASELRFADGQTFAIATPGGSTLSVANPASFGFLGGESAILVSGVADGLTANGGAVSLSAADLAIEWSAIRGDGIALTAVGDSPADVGLDGETSAVPGGVIDVIGSTLYAVAPAGSVASGGDIRLNGGAVFVEGSDLGTDAGFDGQGTGPGGDIRIDSSGSAIVIDSYLFADTVGDAAAGTIRIAATDDLDIIGSSVFSDTYGTGPAGAVTLTGDNITLDGAYITSESFGDGPAGSVSATADDFLAVWNSTISSDGRFGASAGFIQFVGATVAIANSEFLSNIDGDGLGGAVIIHGSGNGGFGSLAIYDSFVTANNGDVILTAADDLILGGATIFTDSYGAGDDDGGGIQILARDIAIDSSYITAENFSDGSAGGTAGRILIEADNRLEIMFSVISLNSYDSGDAGTLFLSARNIVIDSSFASSDSNAAGSAGDVSVFGENISIFDSDLTSEAWGSGAGGDISITARTIALAGASLSTDTFGEGRGGSVAVDASDTIDILLTSLTADTAGSGDAGTLSILSAGTIVIDDSSVFSDTYDAGNAGSVLIQGTDVFLDSAYVTSESFGDTGRAGAVSVAAADELLLANGTIISTTTRGAGAGGAIALSGALVTIENSDIEAETRGGGNAGTLSILSPGLLTVTASIISSNTSGAGAAGAVLIAGAEVRLDETEVTSEASDAGQAGSVMVEAIDELTISNLSRISSSASGSGAGGTVLLRAPTASISDSTVATNSNGIGSAGDLTAEVGELRLVESSLDSQAFDAGAAGTVTVFGDRLEAFNGGISSSTRGGGDAGGVAVDVDSISLVDGSRIISQSELTATGNAGSVFITGQSLLVSDSFVSSSTFTAGNAGNVGIHVDDVTVQFTGSIASQAGPGATGNAGLVDIRAGSLLVEESGFVNSATFGPGAGGTVRIDAGSMIVRAGGLVDSATVGDGSAGLVEIRADQLVVDSNGQVASSTYAFGNAGGVVIDAGSIRVAGGGRIASQSSVNFSDGSIATGNAGTVDIRADSVRVEGGGSISTATVGLGSAGTVLVDAALVTIGDNGSINSTSEGPGAAGLVRVVADTLRLNGGIISSTTSFFDGAGGDIILDVGTLTAERLSRIGSDTLGSGAGGDVVVTADTLNLSSGSLISADTQGSGDGGSVSITANRMTLSDSASVSAVSTLCEDRSCAATGSAGEVSVTAAQLTLTSFSSITSDTVTSGNAGGVSVTADQLTIDNAQISSEASACSDGSCVSSGDGGTVRVAAGTIAMRNGALITSSTYGSGDAGGVEVTARQIALDGAAITSGANFGSTGSSGALSVITSEALSIVGGGSIATESFNRNAAGQVFIQTPRMTISGADSRISSANLYAAGPCAADQCGAGLVRVSVDGADATGILLEDGGRITTNAATGPAGNIELLMAPTTVLTLQGVDAPGIIETSSGAGTGGRIIIASPLAIISNGGSILALGEAGGANASIDTKYFISSSDRANRVAVDGTLTFSNAIYDVSAGTVAVDLSVLDASAVLRGQCGSARATGEVSQLNIRPSGPFGAGIWTDEVPQATPLGNPGGCP